jgi:hypothetical protein
VTAQYCDSGTSCTGGTGGSGIQVWTGFPVALSPGSSLVLTQTTTTTSPAGALYGNFDTSDRIRPGSLNECGFDGSCRVRIELDTTNTGFAPAIVDDMGLGSELSMFNLDPDGVNQCEGHPFLTRGSVGGVTVATGYADNVHLGPSNAAGTCSFLPTPFAPSATVTFKGAGVGKPLSNSPCTGTGATGTCYDAGAILITALAAGPPPPSTGRMTGGGSIFTADGTRVTHGFELHCDPSNTPNNLEINWGGGNNFHLDTLLTATCTDDPTIEPQPPSAPFDTFVGTGVGTCNGQPALISFTLTDAGEPGTKDFASYTISGGCSLTASGFLERGGNQQAHKN